MADAPSAVDIRGLSKSYRTGHVIQGRRPALQDLTLQVRRGEILGYVGPNGSGKTTTLKLLIGLLRPDSGEAFVGDLTPESMVAEDDALSKASWALLRGKGARLVYPAHAQEFVLSF